MNTTSRLGLILLIALALCDAGFRWHSSTGRSSEALVSELAVEGDNCAEFRVVREGLIPMPEGVPAAHASSLVAFSVEHPLHPKKSLAAFWFAGSRESGSDVQIAASTYDNQTQAWDSPEWVVNRHTLGNDLGIQIRRIGNPVAWSDGNGRLHLFVVATGLGGWAASRVVHLTEHSPMRFKAVRILPLMPLIPAFNTSALVRAAPLALTDGGAVLPLYFEIGSKYGMALHLNAHGEMQRLTRITQRHDVLQPSLVAHSSTHWSAFMRNNGPDAMVAHAQTFDAGLHWQDTGNTTLTNPDSSVAALRLSSGNLMLAHNPSDRKREVLQLSMSANEPLAWHARTLVNGAHGDEFSYPTLIEVPQSEVKNNQQPDIWLSYTHLRKAIAYKQLRIKCTAIRSQP